MPTETYGQWMGTPMDERDIDRLLTDAGWGVLSLAEGDEPYSIPVSFGYDGADVFLALIRDSPANTKFEFVEDGQRARLLVTDIGGRFDWQSIAVTGSVRALDRDGSEWDGAVETLDDNAWFSTDFERAEGIEEITVWRLAPDEVRGLEVREDEN
ncbi:pyridoxamine 5'-phosphate oxidase family protein [Haloarcula sp. S1CR25-12]|uniref:Pyridoxamine 5'-phosphate oxidase family protein n=1 Tax=Haloarcula saliterrae TaxID=2950534 RepID=A0ABU2FAD0_9EURY|nr:pyridoxamine 5'-phosphate oxidase family protein [Haloarcula sp. S1CR25-12]MDS0258766.1 pyridoxamine 5'-phosphate oxidase family protein [Haloarcula sp. S1CR25-12]